MEMRQQPRLAGDQLEQRLVHFDAGERRQAQALTTRVTSGIRSNAALSSSAAQPVTRIFAEGRCRRACRIACRVWRTASLVTAQLLTTIQSSSAGANRAMVSLSAKLRRQPRVIVSTLSAASPDRGRR